MHRTCRVTSVVVAIAMGMCPALSAAAATTKALQVKAGKVTGTVMTVTGKPAQKMPVQVRDAKGKTLMSAVTDKDGKFTLAMLPVGQYTLAIGANPLLPVEASMKATQSAVTAVIGEGLGLGMGWLVGAAIGVGVACAVAIPVSLAAVKKQKDKADDAEKEAALLRARLSP